jgi:Na+/melibiose symporter-like transporter
MGISFMWNALHPIVLPAILITLVPDSKKNTYLGLLTFAGLVTAMIIQPLSGAISDDWRSRYGRRRPLMVVATILECVFLFILGSNGGLLWLCIGYIGLQICSNTAQAPLQGLLRDRVPSSQLGVASSLKILLDLLGLVLAGLAAGHMLDAGVFNPMKIMLLLMGLLLLSAAITIFFTPEEPVRRGRANREERTSPDPGAALGWRAGYRSLIAERGLFLLGIYGLQAFGQYYLGDVLQVSDPARRAGDLLASVGAGTVILLVAGAWLMGRVGAKRILYLASGITAVGLLLMGFTNHIEGVIVFGCTVGAGIGLFLSSNWTLANRLAPEAQSGRFLGLTNLATAGSAALARLQGPAVDYLNSARPGEWIGYRGVFIFGALCVLASTLFLTRIHGRS